MSLSEARRFADAPFAVSIASDARLMKAAKALFRSDAPEDAPRKLKVSAEQVTRIWQDMPHANS
jgi:hypothetical protein